jgi:predicted DnaQ family exonuclease/DinG family helicase
MSDQPTYIALDLETTGTNAQNDRIIEIGAVRFTPDAVVETFARLVNPGRRLPYRVHVLTGLSDEELQQSPRIEVVLGELEEFIGGYPLVGQSVDFDIAFLRQAGLEPAVPAYDTFELASLFVPEARDYGLRGLAEFFDLDFPVRHRALEDALAAKDVFLALRRRIHSLPPSTLHEILRLATGLDWSARDLLAEVAAPQALFLHGQNGDQAASKSPQVEQPQDLRPRGPRRVVAPAEASQLIRHAGEQGLIEAFEERPQQFDMSEAVAQAFSGSKRLVIEAGTGTGKSLAYLVPAALHALRNGERVVISTDTINLQEQLQGKDIPAMRGALQSVEGIADLRVTTLKGRRNYLCLLAWRQAMRQPAANLDELAVFVRLLVWLPSTETGDRSELNIAQQQEPVWTRLSAQNEDCLSGPSIYVKQGSCFLLRARRRAEAAHVLVVNHALLMADLASEGGVIPPYQHLIVDEGHNLEEEATRGLGFASSIAEVETFLDGVAPAQGQSGGLVAFLRAATRGQQATSGIATLNDEVHDLSARARDGAQRFFAAVASFVEEHASDGFDGERRLHLTAGTRAQPAWSAVEVTWDNLALVLSRLEERLIKLFSALLRAHSAGELDAEALVMQVDGAASTCREIANGIAAIVERHDAQRICWASVSRRGDIGIASAPLSVGETLKEKLFDQKLSAIVTSATLTAGGSFDYLKQRIGLEEADELLLGSPFDFKSAVLVLLPTDMPEPQESGYQKAVEESVTSLVQGSEGRALALFTSHSALRATYHSIREGLEGLDIQVLAQGIDGTARQLITALRENDRTLLLGTASFWEGVDIAGEALSMLIIARLPFPVPVDPIFAARSELFDDPFTEYALPQAILRFKQGFGRLIRHRDDRGVVAVLDRRLLTRSYGPLFLESLPECTVRRLPLRSLEEAGRDWLARSRPEAVRA